MIDDKDVSARFHLAFDAQPSPGAAERLRSSLLAADRARGKVSRTMPVGLHVSFRIVAALALVVIVLAASGAFVALHRAVTNTVPTNPPTSTHPIARSSSVAEGGQPSMVGMVNAMVGWEVTSTEIQRTTDAGAHWTAVGPPKDLFTQAPRSFYLLDGDHMWLTQSISAAPRVQIFTVSTADGGAKWSKGASVAVDSRDYSSSSQYFSLSLDFLDVSHGWMLVQPLHDGTPTGPRPQTAHVYRTTDGGATWLEIAHIDLGPSIQPDANGQNVMREGSGCWWDAMAFASVTDGWLTQNGPCLESSNAGVLAGDEPPWYSLLVTHDGGVTWYPDLAPLGPICACHWPPVVFDQTHVMLEVRGVSYVSRDAGQTWTKLTIPTSAAGTLADFIDPVHGWLQDGSGGLDITTDGGMTWSKVNASLPFNDADLQFVDARHGFAIEPDALNSTETKMWKTTDGGRTWTRVGHVLA
jgi:photosystem II stability/assembly factor-like uncharacterized protein